MKKKKPLASKPKKSGADKLKNKVIPLGDPKSSLLKWDDGTTAHASIRKFAPSQTPNPKPPLARESFLENQQLDLDFMPADGRLRRERRLILREYIRSVRGKIFLLPMLPMHLERLVQQQRRSDFERESLEAVFGVGATWRDGLTFEAKHNFKDARFELSEQLLYFHIIGDDSELKRFTQAACRVRDFFERKTPWHKLRAALTLYGFAHESVNGCGNLPKRAIAEKALEKKGFKFPTNNRGRIYSGPYLSKFPLATPWEAA